MIYMHGVTTLEVPMLRFALPLIALSTVACNLAEARDHQAVWTALQTDEASGMAGVGLSYTVEVNAAAREMETEVEVDMGGIFVEGEALQLDMWVTEGLTEVGEAGLRSSEDDASVYFTPDFRTCDGLGYTETADGGCEVSGIALILGDRPYSIVVGVTARTQAPEGWEGDKDTLDVIVNVE